MDLFGCALCGLGAIPFYQICGKACGWTMILVGMIQESANHVNVASNLLREGIGIRSIESIKLVQPVLGRLDEETSKFYKEKLSPECIVLYYECY